MATIIPRETVLTITNNMTNTKNIYHILCEYKKGNISQNSKYVFVPCIKFLKTKTDCPMRMIPIDLFMNPNKMNKDGKLLCKECRRLRHPAFSTFKYGYCCSDRIELLELFEGAWVCGMCI